MTTIVATETNFAQGTVADIAATMSGVARIFQSKKLDFYCGGQVFLADAALAKGLRLTELEADLVALIEEHDDHGIQPRKIEDLTGNFLLPSNARPIWQAHDGSRKKFVGDVMEHIQIENTFLFQRFTGTH